MPCGPRWTGRDTLKTPAKWNGSPETRGGSARTPIVPRAIPAHGARSRGRQSICRVEGEQFAEALQPDRQIVRALHHVGPLLHVALDDDRAAIGDRDIEADHDAI